MAPRSRWNSTQNADSLFHGVRRSMRPSNFASPPGMTFTPKIPMPFGAARMASGANEMSMLSAAELASSATAIFPSASRASPVTLASSGFLTALVNSPPALSGPATASLAIPSYV